MSEAREFKPVAGNSDIEFISAKNLLETDRLGIIAEGTFEEALENNFDNTKRDYKIITDDGKTFVFNHAGSLAYQMKRVTPGSYVRISYNGQEEMQRGPMKGKLAHQFTVEVA